MSRTCLEVACDPAGGRPRVSVGTDGPRGRGHLGVRVLSLAPGRVRVALVAEGALLLAGDEVHVGMRVGPGAALEVVEPAGTVAYDMRGGQARWSVEVTVAEGASLVWRAEPFVVATGAVVDREVEIRLRAGGAAVLREVLVLGRAGEAGGILRQRFRALVEDEPLMLEDLWVDGARPQAGVLAGYRVIDSVSVLGRQVGAVPTPSGSHRLDLEGDGTVWRHLGDTVHGSPLEAAWREVA